MKGAICEFLVFICAEIGVVKGGGEGKNGEEENDCAIGEHLEDLCEDWLRRNFIYAIKK